jgi:hypothetical protein
MMMIKMNSVNTRLGSVEHISFLIVYHRKVANDEYEDEDDDDDKMKSVNTH